jgi:hypothetical protein
MSEMPVDSGRTTPRPAGEIIYPETGVPSASGYVVVETHRPTPWPGALLAAHARRLTRELARFADLFAQPPDRAHFDADLAWVEPLSDADRDEIRYELAAALVAAMLTGRWERYDEALDAWKATAAVLADRALTARLLAESNPSEEVPLERP